MEKKTIYLASASPRRREILTTAGFSPVIIKADADESSVKFTKNEADAYVMALARLKNEAAVRDNKNITSGIIITADTVVVGDEAQSPLGKPKSHEDAVAMLKSLSGRSHRVITGVMLTDIESGKSSLFAESTEVIFRTLSDEEIEEYCSGNEPYDKAGGYGIQGKASVFVKAIVGDYFNVVGLPVCRVYKEIRQLM